MLAPWELACVETRRKKPGMITFRELAMLGGFMTSHLAVDSGAGQHGHVVHAFWICFWQEQLHGG